MSVVAIAAVFTLDLAPHLKWLLVCLADNAGPWGRDSYPSIASLCQKSGMSERTVQRNLALLETRGLIVKQDERDRTVAWLKSRGTPTTVWSLAFMTRPTLELAPRPANISCPPGLRVEVIEAFQRTCQYCHGVGGDELGPDGARWHVDRIRPAQRGGSYSPENVTLACRRCNVKKGANMASLQPRALSSLVGDKMTAPDKMPDAKGAKAASPMAPKPSIEPSKVRTTSSLRSEVGAERPQTRSAVNGKAVASVVAAVAESISRRGSPSMEPVVKAALASQTRDLLRGGWELDEVRSTAIGLALEWEPQRRYSKLMHLGQRQRAKTAQEQAEQHQARQLSERRAADDERYRADMADPSRHWYRPSEGDVDSCGACGAPRQIAHAARPALGGLRPVRVPLIDAAATTQT